MAASVLVVGLARLAAGQEAELHLIVPRPVSGESDRVAAVRTAIAVRRFAEARSQAALIANLAERRLWTGIAALLDGDAYGAVRSLRAGPVESVAAWKALAMAYSQAHQWLLFRQAMERAAELDPSDTDAHYALASYWNSQGADGARAEAGFRKVLALDPRHRLAHYYLGTALERENRVAEAEAAFRASLDSAPSGLAWLGLARLRRAAGRADESLAFARKAAELSPNDPEITRFVARLLNDGQPREALPHWRRLTEIAPNDPANWYGLYRLLLVLQDDAGAAQARRQFDVVRRAYGNH